MNADTRLTVTLLALFSIGLATGVSFAAEKDGLRIEVVPRVLTDKSAVAAAGSFSTPVDQEMSLKATIKNISMKDTPESSIDYVVLVQRWAAETGSYSSYKGTEKLPALRFAEQVEIDIGKYHVGGHLHGGSDMHKDRLAAWKIVVTQGDKKIEFVSSSSFESLAKTAKPEHVKHGHRGPAAGE